MVVCGFLIFVLIPRFLGRRREAGSPEQTARSGAAAMATRQAAYNLEESGRRAPRDPETGDSSPPVLLLSHFCAATFLCFGDVRVGTSRTRSLVLQNPHEEPLQVELSLLRAAGQGFSVVPSRCELKVGARGTSPWRGALGIQREKLSQLPAVTVGYSAADVGLGAEGTPTLGQLPVLILGHSLCRAGLGLERDPDTKSTPPF